MRNVGEGTTERHLWAVGSGWDGPFQLAEVLVTAPDRDAAIARAEGAYAAARQPVCRAKMRVRDLGPADDALVVGPFAPGASLLEAGEASGLRCAPEGLSVR